MRQREDNRSIATRIIQATAKGLFIAALGLALGSLFGDIGIPARALGVLGALAVSGTAVAVGEYATQAEQRRCEERQRAIEEEDRRMDAFVIENRLTRLVTDLAHDRVSEKDSIFVQRLDEQRRQAGGKQHLH